MNFGFELFRTECGPEMRLDTALLVTLAGQEHKEPR